MDKKMLIGCLNSMKVVAFFPSLLLFSQLLTSAHADVSPVLRMMARDDLSFQAVDLLSTRTDEVFEVGPVPVEFQVMTKNIFENSLMYFPRKYWPSHLNVVLESSAFVTSETETGRIPLSIVNSYQFPRTSMIRIGMFELENDHLGYRWIMGHEIGHMIVEWSSRKAGSTDINAPRISFWVQSVYEGVGDYFAAILSEDRDFSKKKRWYYRDIFRFETLDESIAAKDNTITRAEKAFAVWGLSSYALYQDWLAKVKSYTKGRDPYMPGSWLAGQLYLCGRSASQERVAKEIVNLAVDGKRFTSPESFLWDVRLRSECE